MQGISIIIPTYNEAKNLAPLVEEIFVSLNQAKISAEIIFVDDNSPDGTGRVAEKLAEKYPIIVIHRAGKLGLGSAVRAGFAASKGEIIGVMDADLSHDPAILPQLFEALADNDIVVGSRLLPESRVDDWPWQRRWISKIGVLLARKMTKVPAADPLSGYFFLHQRVIAEVPLTTIGYKILFEILCKGNYTRIKELPFHFRKREYNQSKLNFKEHWLFFKQLVKYARAPRS